MARGPVGAHSELALLFHKDAPQYSPSLRNT